MKNLNQTEQNTSFLQNLRELINQQNPEQQWIVDNLLFMTVSGSRLYGTNSENSDYDVRGVVLPPKDYWVGARSFEQFVCKMPAHDLDFCIYDFRKWLNLTVAVNPNVVELLYVNKDNPNVCFWSDDWDKIRKETKKLINQRAYIGFHGYSTSQMKKMSIKQANKTGRQYIAQAMGFDTKFVSHAFRLIHQGEELMLKNNMTFPRPEAQLLKDIRNGMKYNQNQQMKCLADWEEEQKRLEIAKENTCLPEKADFNLYNNLLISTFDNLVNRI